MRIPEVLSRQKACLSSIIEAKQEIESRTAERYAEEKREDDKKMAERTAIEQETGKKFPGKNPKPPEPGP